MRILFVTHVTNMAGANRSMYQLIKELKEEYGVEPVVLAPVTEKPHGSIIDSLQEIGVPVITTEIRFFKLEHPTLRNVLGYARYLWRLRQLVKQLQDYHFDIIHSNSSVIDIGGYLSKQLGIKHVWHLREYGDLDYSLKPIGGQWYERYTYRHADAYIAISKSVANYYRNKVPFAKVHTIYNGILAAADMPLSTHDNVTVQFFCAGIISEGKNQKEIVQAMDELINVRQIKKPCRLTLVGIHTQPYTDELIALINEKRLTEYVRVLPEMNGIQSLAATMDVGIMCSKAEAFGRVTIEYQLQNLLVIANESGANTELIEDGITGILYKSGDFRSLADKMCWVLDHYAEIDAISSAGRSYAQHHFSSTNNSKQVYELYKKLGK